MFLRRIAVVVLFLLSPFLLSHLQIESGSPGRAAHAAEEAGPVVTTLLDQVTGCEINGCSLREAIDEAQTGEKITFSVSGPIVLNAAYGDLDISDDLTIDGGGSIIVSGADAVRVFNVIEGIVKFKGLTIADGKASNCGLAPTQCGGGIFMQSTGAVVTVIDSTISGNGFSGDGQGGGIFNGGGTLNVTDSTISGNTAKLGGGINNQAGTVTVTNSTISGNTADAKGAGIHTSEGSLTISSSIVSGNGAFNSGGGIHSGSGSVVITNSTFSNNQSDEYTGGGIHNSSGYLIVTGSTFSGNSCFWEGGAINNAGTVTVTNSTFSDNAGNEGGGIFNSGTATVDNSTVTNNSVGTTGGGISSSPTGGTSTTLANTIVSGNYINTTGLPASDLVIFPATYDSFNSGGYNLIGTFSGTTAFDATGDMTGVTDPKLGPLAANGGYTWTHAVLSDSQALDNGRCNSGPETDQRGAARPQNNNCDIGAFEVACTMTVMNNASTGPGSLRDAILAVCNGGLVNFDGGLANSTIDISPDGELLIDKSLTVEGNVPVTVSGNDAERVFNVTSGTVSFNSLTIADGNVSTKDCGGNSIKCGGGIMLQNSSVKVTVNDSTISGHKAYFGAAIGNEKGNLTVNDSLLTNNEATNGGGIFNSGRLTINESTISSNSGVDGAGIYNRGGIAAVNESTLFENTADNGGAIYSNGGSMSVNNSTLSGNSADRGGALLAAGGNVRVINSTVSGNQATSGGGGIASRGNATTFTSLKNSIVSGNFGGGTTTADDLVLYDGTSNSFTSGGYNLIGTMGANISLAGQDDQLNVNNPLLGALADHGGETMTRGLLPGSPAIDAGGVCGVAKDQRGITRPKGSACDTGAFESRGFSLALKEGSPQMTLVNRPFAKPLALTVSSAHGEPVVGGRVTFKGPTSGAGLTITKKVVTIGGGGAVSLRVTANGEEGAYVVTADTVGNVGSAVGYQLKNSNTLYVFLPVIN